MKNSPNKLMKNQRGIAAVEFALVLPILVVLFAFTIFFGRLCWHYTAALKAAHDAATFMAMSRNAEIGINKSDLSVIEVAAIAKSIAQTEVAELNPGKGAAPVVSVNCDNYACIGDKVPVEISVMVRMKIYDPFFSVVTDEIAGSEGMWFYAEVRMPYVGN